MVVAEQRMAKVGELGATCPLCHENMDHFEITDADTEADAIHVDGTCPVHGYVSGWTRRTKA